jgi:hypothetical protein
MMYPHQIYLALPCQFALLTCEIFSGRRVVTFFSLFIGKLCPNVLALYSLLVREKYLATYQ